MLNAFVMKFFGRPHKNVVTAVFGIQTEFGKHFLEFARDIINLFLRCSAVRFGSALDIDAVFVRSRQEISIETALPFMPLNHVGNDRRVKMTEMRQRIGVIDRRCYVKSLHNPKYKSVACKEIFF
mgnify:CR=1 FL=1